MINLLILAILLEVGTWTYSYIMRRRMDKKEEKLQREKEREKDAKSSDIDR